MVTWWKFSKTLQLRQRYSYFTKHWHFISNQNDIVIFNVSIGRHIKIMLAESTDNVHLYIYSHKGNINEKYLFLVISFCLFQFLLIFYAVLHFPPLHVHSMIPDDQKIWLHNDVVRGDFLQPPCTTCCTFFSNFTI